MQLRLCPHSFICRQEHQYSKRSPFLHIWEFSLAANPHHAYTRNHQRETRSRLPSTRDSKGTIMLDFTTIK